MAFFTRRNFFSSAAAAAAFGVVLLAPAAQAMRVSPMVAEITTRGAGSAARIEVQNINQVPLPFEARVTRIDYDAQGVMTETPADGDFLVFPPQGLIPPSGRQVVRMQWVGDPALPTSRAYYLAIRQLPVALERPTETMAAQVQVVYHMKALITVAPPGAAPKVELVSATPVQITPPAEPGKPAGAASPGVEIKVRNTGARYAMMSAAKWTIEGADRAGKPLKVEVSPDELNRVVGVGYLAPAGGLRTFQVPTAAAFGPGPIKVRFGR
jgi:fimbrial chaperone protein